jgi:hypothetical protein
MPRGMHAQTDDQSVIGLATPIRGAIDEKNEVYKRAIEVEEGKEDDDADVEGNQPARPVLRVHSVRIGLVMILVLVTQSLGIARVCEFFSANRKRYNQTMDSDANSSS